MSGTQLWLQHPVDGVADRREPGSRVEPHHHRTPVTAAESPIP